MRDVFEYVLRHKGERAFRFYPEQDILVELLRAHYAGGLFIVNGLVGEITGMVIAEVVNDNEFEVKQLICTHPTALKWMRKMGRKVFGGRMCRYVKFGVAKTLRRI